ncbi:hypothetical protein [Mobilicoccus massiliensis]|uniref:hypothetical protein n=1 Tax=Mobilicoccus massiliensis TaxID=1522310 RepID=UPI00058C714B|nr:hypothetical protein [Mobilicoccus massiliensis]
MELLQQVLFALLPSVGIGFLFYKIMRLLLEGDRKERAAYSRWLADQDAQRAESVQRPHEFDDSAPVEDGTSSRRM